MRRLVPYFALLAFLLLLIFWNPLVWAKRSGGFWYITVTLSSKETAERSVAAAEVWLKADGFTLSPAPRGGHSTKYSKQLAPGVTYDVHLSADHTGIMGAWFAEGTWWTASTRDEARAKFEQRFQAFLTQSAL